MTRGVICVHGTWGADFENTSDQWWEYGSPFCLYLGKAGFNTVVCDEEFQWSGNADGLARLWPWNWFRTPEQRTWKAGGRALGYYLKGIDYADRNILAHSHGGQVALLAAARGVKMRRLITIGTPVRKDMQGTVEKARPNIHRWLHIIDPRDDDIQIYGGIGDGELGVNRLFTHADVIGTMAGGHSSILNDPKRFDLWRSRGWLRFLEDTDDERRRATFEFGPDAEAD
jgi:hypothetical protein